MKEINSKSKLAIILSKLKVFEDPSIRSEQYSMDSEIGAQILWDAYLKGYIDGKVSADLGCGTGILGIGTLLLGAKKVIFLDNSTEVMEIVKKNINFIESEGLTIDPIGKTEFQCKNVKEFKTKVDTIIQNPPFGTKVRHADKSFLEIALKYAQVVYTFHKSTSEKFIQAIAKDNGFKVSEKWNFSFPLKATHEFHRRKIHRINVSCWKLNK